MKRWLLILLAGMMLLMWGCGSQQAAGAALDDTPVPMIESPSPAPETPAPSPESSPTPDPAPAEEEPEPEQEPAAAFEGYDETPSQIFFSTAAAPGNRLMYIDSTAVLTGEAGGVTYVFVQSDMGKLILYYYPDFSGTVPAAGPDVIRFYYIYTGWSDAAGCPAGAFIGCTDLQNQGQAIMDAKVARRFVEELTAPSSPEPTSDSAEDSRFPYLLTIVNPYLPYYDGPGYTYAVNGVINGGGTYTIVDEYEERTSGGAVLRTWGKLKSGAGWIDLRDAAIPGGNGFSQSQYPPFPATPYPEVPFLYYVDDPNYPIYAGPGFEYDQVGVVEYATNYTIVEVNEVSTPYKVYYFGRLKSGAGWIVLYF